MKLAMRSNPWNCWTEWETELNACYAGSPKHPVFVALAETVKQCGIPQHEFSDLLIAFRQRPDGYAF